MATEKTPEKQERKLQSEVSHINLGGVGDNLDFAHVLDNLRLLEWG